MDAFVQLALIEKAKRVFAPDASVLLSFPLLAPIGFTAEELEALSAPATAADYAAAGDFARIVNFVAFDMVATATERKLWDVYRDVLHRAEVGDVVPDGDEGSPAADILYQDGPDGTRVESDALKRYRQYRDAWIVAREDYAAHKLTGELSEDPAERQNWTEVDEPALRAALDAAASAWDTLGGRPAIEAALQAERDAAFRDPRRRWAEWSSLFNPDLDMMNDAGGQYAPTGFSPRNFAEQDGWLSFTMSASEMRTLVNEAPEALKRVLDDDEGTIERVSFEYRSVALVRPWFRSEALTSGIWRSDDPELILSDGEAPPTGACPAYASACVFVRNVEVTRGGSRPGNTSTVLPLKLDPARLTLRRDLRVDHRTNPDPRIKPPARRRARPAPAPEPAPTVLPHSFQMLALSTFAKVPTQLLVAQPAAVRTAIRQPIRLDAQVKASQTTRRKPDSSGTPAPSPEAPPSAPSTSAPRDEISVLAFICKRLPKVPDPAPELAWGSDPEPAKTYVVVSGDTLRKIAAKVYGNSARWKKVYNANRETIGPDPNRIRVGQELILP